MFTRIEQIKFIKFFKMDKNNFFERVEGKLHTLFQALEPLSVSAFLIAFTAESRAKVSSQEAFPKSPQSFSQTTAESKTSQIGDHSGKLVFGVSLLHPFEGCIGTTATAIDIETRVQQGQTFLVAPLVRGETSFLELINSRINLFNHQTRQVFSQNLPRQAKQKFSNLYKCSKTLLYFVLQLEKVAFHDPSFIVLSPKLAELKQSVNELCFEVAGILYSNFTFESGLVLVKESDPARVIQRLDELSGRSLQLLKDFLIARFEISMVKLTGMGTNEHRILRPITPFGENQ
jgi:hypothetical protein